MIRVKWLDDDGNEIRDGWINMLKDDIRDDFQAVIAIDLSMSDVPDEFDCQLPLGLEKAPCPGRVGESVVAFGVAHLTRLS